MRPYGVLAAFLFLLFFFSGDSSARLRVEIPPAPPRFLHDGASLLTAAERGEIETRLMALDRDRLQVGVVILPSLNGEPLEDVTFAIAEGWAPGDAELDDGVLLAVFVNDRKMRIEVGYGLESRINDARAGRILRNDMAPAFRQQRFARGILAAINSIEAAAEGRKLPAESNESFPGFAIIIAIFILIVLILLITTAARRHRGVWISSAGWGTISGSGRSGGGWSSGGGFSGSFGGGSFGGGGASGSW